MTPELQQNIEATYPNFEQYVRQVRGYMVCPTLSQIILWHEYLEFQKEIMKASKKYATETTRTDKPTT